MEGKWQLWHYYKNVHNSPIGESFLELCHPQPLCCGKNRNKKLKSWALPLCYRVKICHLTNVGLGFQIYKFYSMLFSLFTSNHFHIAGVCVWVCICVCVLYNRELSIPKLFFAPGFYTGSLSYSEGSHLKWDEVLPLSKTQLSLKTEKCPVPLVFFKRQSTTWSLSTLSSPFSTSFFHLPFVLPIPEHYDMFNPAAWMVLCASLVCSLAIQFPCWIPLQKAQLMCHFFSKTFIISLLETLFNLLYLYF